MVTIDFTNHYSEALEMLTQWNANQTLMIRGLSTQTTPVIAFSNRASQTAVAVQARTVTGGYVCDIPNGLLTKPYTIYVDVRVSDGTGIKSIERGRIRVRPTSKPDDYEYVENITLVDITSFIADIDTVKSEFNSIKSMVGGPSTAGTKAAMTDTSKVYVYTGSETGMVNGNWYYHDGTNWVSGGVYNATAVDTDKTLSVDDMAADAAAAGSIIEVGSTQPSSEANKLWIDPSADEIEIPEMSDLKIVEDKVDDLKSAISELDEIVSGVSSVNYEANKNLSTITGELVSEDGTNTSEFIPLTWTGLASYDCGDNTKYTYQISFYDANKAYIQSFRNPANTGGVTYRGINAATQVTQGTAAYVRFSFKSGYAGKIFINAQQNYWIAESSVSGGLAGEIGDLEELNTSEKSSIVKAINEVNGKIVPLPITPSDTNFFYTSPNLADPSAFVANEFVNQTNGVFTSYPGHTRTGFIPVAAGKTYCIINSADFNAGIRYAFYSSASESAYLSGANVNLDDVDNLVTAPTDAAYMVMSASTSRFPFMIAENDTKIDYEEYGETYLLPEYVLDEDVADIPVNLPSKIYTLVGYELNIYFENIVEDWTQYNFDVTCAKGMQLERGYQITPTASDVGTYPLSIVISSKDGRSSKAVTTTLIVASASAGSGVAEKVLVLGDSTTNSGYAVTKLAQNLADDPMGITLLGTRGTAPYMHEGRSGWTFNLYFTSAGSGSVVNPFYNPTTETFDASYYFSNTGVAVPDWFIINLGINDVFSFTTDSSLEAAIPTIKGMCDDMIASVKAVSANIKIGLCITIPPNHSQDAFGKAYYCGQTRNRYKRNNVIWANSLIAEYDGRESESIYLIPIYTNLDTVWNMGVETLPVNARNTAVTYESPIGNGGVHPAENGYWQIADVYTAFLKAQA